MRIVEPPQVKSVAAIAAHPDDIESWCAGTLALAVERGATARLLLVTSGEHGTSDPHAAPHQVALTREREALLAAQTLGIAQVVFLRQPDGAVEDTAALRRELVRCIRQWQPEALFTHDPEHPWPPYLSHRDHRVVGRSALDAVYPLARDPLAFAELKLQPHAVRELWLCASDAPDVCVDISASFARKLEARLAHASQTPDPAALPASWRERAARIGAAAGVPLSEAFKLLRLE